jgi:hypothetical protein
MFYRSLGLFRLKPNTAGPLIRALKQPLIWSVKSVKSRRTVPLKSVFKGRSVLKNC